MDTDMINFCDKCCEHDYDLECASSSFRVIEPTVKTYYKLLSGTVPLYFCKNQIPTYNINLNIGILTCGIII